MALLASDQAWLWNRGYEGGGPQLELLRRLAHWMMKEPELEEEALWAEATGQTMRIIRRTLEEEVGTVTVTAPRWQTEEVDAGGGRARAGSRRSTRGPRSASTASQNGDQERRHRPWPRRAARVRADHRHAATAGAGDRPVRTAAPSGSRTASPTSARSARGAPLPGAAGSGSRRANAYETLDVTQTPLLPAWLVLLLASALDHRARGCARAAARRRHSPVPQTLVGEGLDEEVDEGAHLGLGEAARADRPRRCRASRPEDPGWRPRPAPFPSRSHRGRTADTRSRAPRRRRSAATARHSPTASRRCAPAASRPRARSPSRRSPIA